MTEMTTAELASGAEYADVSLYAETCPCGTVVPMSDHGHDDHWALMEQARQRVAEGNASTIESAVWSITYSAGYVHGRSDAQAGTARDITGASEGYAAGYASGYRWGIAHPLPAFQLGA